MSIAKAAAAATKIASAMSKATKPAAKAAHAASTTGRSKPFVDKLGRNFKDGRAIKGEAAARSQAKPVGATRAKPAQNVNVNELAQKIREAAKSGDHEPLLAQAQKLSKSQLSELANAVTRNPSGTSRSKKHAMDRIRQRARETSYQDSKMKLIKNFTPW